MIIHHGGECWSLELALCVDKERIVECLFPDPVMFLMINLLRAVINSDPPLPSPKAPAQVNLPKGRSLAMPLWDLGLSKGWLDTRPLSPVDQPHQMHLTTCSMMTGSSI